MKTLHRVLLCLAQVALIAGGANPNPSTAGMDSHKLRELPRRLQKFVEDGTISGAVTLVARHGHTASLDAVGLADIAANQPMRTDTLFWIASMTKPITATAVLMLKDEGKLNVDDPVEKYRPEFKGQWMIESRSAESIVLKRPPGPTTLRDLLTHTSGIRDVPAPRPDCSLAELAMAYSQQPLQFPPGSKWQYSNPGINTLGRIVEVVSGERFSEFIEKRLFKPIGMKDTTFWPTLAHRKRLAKSYQPAKDGRGLEGTEIFFIKGDISDRRRTPFPAGGLFSAAPDLFRFYQTALNGGTLDGEQFLSLASVELMIRTQTGDLNTGLTDGVSFGLGGPWSSRLD